MNISIILAAQYAYQANADRWSREVHFSSAVMWSPKSTHQYSIKINASLFMYFIYSLSPTLQRLARAKSDRYQQ